MMPSALPMTTFIIYCSSSAHAAFTQPLNALRADVKIAILPSALNMRAPQ